MITEWASRTFKALQHRHYLVLWLGTALSFLAFMMSAVVQSLVAYDLTGKNGAVGLVALGMGVATIVLSPFGGVLADRLSKRRLLFIGQTLIGLNFVVVGVLIITDTITIWSLVASTFVMGTVFSFIGPARQAWIGDLLPGDDLPNGIALQQVSMTSTRIIGPLLAGAMAGVAFIGTGGTYLFMGVLFAVVVGSMWWLPATQARPRAVKVSVLGDIKLGLTHIQERPRLMLVALSFIGVVLAGYSYMVLLPGLLTNELGHSSRDMSWLLVASAVGGLAVTMGLAGMANSPHVWRLMLGGGVVFSGALVLLAASGSFLLAMGAMVLVGGGSATFQMLNNALVMRESEQEYFGRVMSITMLAWGFNGLAGYPFGRMADVTGERTVLLLMGVLVGVITVGTALAHVMLNRRAEAALHAVASPAGGR